MEIHGLPLSTMLLRLLAMHELNSHQTYGRHEADTHEAKLSRNPTLPNLSPVVLEFQVEYQTQVGIPN